MVDHFPLKTAANVPGARGLRDWDASELINQGLRLPAEVDADLLPKPLKQNLQLPFDPREDGPVSSPHSLISTLLGKSRTLGRRRLCLGGSGASAARPSLLYS
jgi:hypothetical protein